MENKENESIEKKMIIDVKLPTIISVGITISILVSLKNIAKTLNKIEKKIKE